MTSAREHHADCDVAIIRQHTLVQTWVDSSAEMLCMRIVGEHSVMVLGLTSNGAAMLMSQVTTGLNDLRTEQQNRIDCGQLEKSRTE